MDSRRLFCSISVTDLRLSRRSVTKIDQNKLKCMLNVNKKALLSQRRPRDAPNVWVPEKFRESSQTPPATFPEICKGLLLQSILRMCIQNLKFVALSVPEIIGGRPTEKNWAVPVYAHTPVSPKFLIGFCSYGPSEYICQI